MGISEDIQYMRHAMAVAQKGEGRVNPNPLVGAVIVRNNEDNNTEIIAEGWHHGYGQLHAERDAFRNADEASLSCQDTTMYVTLEPCCHHGNQPPCTEAIIAHKVKRVVVGFMDPNPIVAGKGIKQLKEAGIQVDMIGDLEGGQLLEKELRYQNRVFIRYISTGRPWVFMKYAMTLDGKICTHTGDSRWISGEESREEVHRMRKALKAIMCGIGTVLADDPMLNTRIPGEEDARNPIRIVLDRKLRIPLDCKLVQTAREIPTIVAYSEGADEGKIKELNDLGVTTWYFDTLEELLRHMRVEKIDGVMLEGGGTINEAFLRDGLVDEVYAIIAPKIVGGKDAKTPVEGLGVNFMAEAIKLHETKIEFHGDNIIVRGLCSQE